MREGSRAGGCAGLGCAGPVGQGGRPLHSVPLQESSSGGLKCGCPAQPGLGCDAQLTPVGVLEVVP